MARAAPPPDFVIAGAAKCGTTALYEYLLGHPGIFLSPHKEPKYFCTDLRTAGGVYEREGYLALFGSAPRDCLTGEASPLYLYSKVAIERIIANNVATKVIVMLRNPVEAAHSLHSARWSHRIENIEDFEEAWRAQEVRLAGRRLPPGWPDPQTLQYGAMYRYAEQVRRVIASVPAAQRHFVVYEEFFADPGRHFTALLQFLGARPSDRTDFPIVNPAIGPRSRRIERLLREPPAGLKALYAPLKPLFRAAGFNPAAALWGLNRAPRGKPPIRPAFRAELERYFQDDVAELERLLDRRLWS